MYHKTLNQDQKLQPRSCFPECITAALLGIISGYVVASNMNEELLFFLGFMYAFITAPIIIYVLYTKLHSYTRSLFLTCIWLVLGGASWYAAFWTTVYVSKLVDSTILALIPASVVGFTVVWLLVPLATKRFKLKHYVVFCTPSAIVAVGWALLAELTGGDFDSFSDDRVVTMIHVCWQAMVSYFIVFSLFPIRAIKYT